VVITGPTAVGKSQLALELAARLDGEIISADSRQVYRYMDVGTAKPSPAERAAVPHHMIDMAYPQEGYSAADYQRDGGRILGEINSRGRLALVVGGSPHYVQALMDGLRPPPRHPALRAWLDRTDRADDSNPPARLDRWLQELDPLSSRAIDPRNRRRVLRALEVSLAEGHPFSEVGRELGPPVPAVRFALRLDRETLHRRVEERMAQMLRAGWLEEVRTLLAMGYSTDLPAMTATGYALLAQVILGRLDLSAATERIRFATHAFIRQQETWLRADPQVQWLEAEDPDLVRHVTDVIRRLTASGARRK
jgi:tRNA dimethylallyltransferase